MTTGERVTCPSCDERFWANNLAGHLVVCKGKLLVMTYGTEDQCAYARRRARSEGLRFKSGKRYVRIDGEKLVVVCWTVRRAPVRVTA